MDLLWASLFRLNLSRLPTDEDSHSLKSSTAADRPADELMPPMTGTDRDSRMN